MVTGELITGVGCWYLLQRHTEPVEWLAARLGQIHEALSRLSTVPISVIEVTGVPDDLLEIRNGILIREGYGGQIRHVRPSPLPKGMTVAGDTVKRVGTRGKPSLRIETPWDHHWKSDWDNRAGTILQPTLWAYPVGMSPAQLEVYSALCADGWKPLHAVAAAAII